MSSGPISDKEQTLARIIRKIESAVKDGDPFMIEKLHKPDYVKAGGNADDLDKYIKQAKINEAKKPEWNPEQNTCKYCEPWWKKN